MAGANSDLLAMVQNYFATTPIDVMAMHALIGVMWFPIFAVLIHGMALLWLELKQNKFSGTLKFIVLEIQVPRDTVQTPKGMENFFSNMAGMLSTPTWKEKWLLGKEMPVFSFELASLGGSIHYYIRAQSKFKELLEATLYAQYPEAIIIEVPDWTNDLVVDYPNDDVEVFGSEIVLKNPSYFPIRTYSDFEHQGEKDNRFKDPLLPLLEVLGQVKPGETMGLQIIISGHDGQWVKDGIEFLGKVMGKEPKIKPPGTAVQIAGLLASLPTEAMYQLSGFDVAGTHAGDSLKKADDFRAFKLTQAEKIQIEYVAEKITKVGWKGKIRWFGMGPKTAFRKGVFASGIKAVIQPFSSPLLNSLTVHGLSVPKDDYFWQLWSYTKRQKSLVTRFKKRSLGAGATPTIFGAEELATLWHFPAADARTPVLQSLGARRAEAPAVLPLAGDVDFFDWKASSAAQADEGSDVQPPTSSVISALPQPPSITLPSPSLALPEDNGAEPPENLPL